MLEITLSNSWTIPAAIVLISLLYYIPVIVYRIYFHPLSKFPGPLLCKITEWNLNSTSLLGNSTKVRHDWLQKYGDVVRVAPNELDFGNMASVKDIYGQSSDMPEKDVGFYRHFSITGPPNLVSSSWKPEHSRIRRLTSHAFAFKTVMAFEDRQLKHVERYFETLMPMQQPVDIYNHTHSLYLDIISDLSFDKCFNCLEDEEASHEAKDAERAVMIATVKAMIPFAELIPLEFIREGSKARPRLTKFARACVSDLQRRIEKGQVEGESLLRRMIETKLGGEQLTDDELMENAIIFIQAGAGTSHVVTIYFIWLVERHPAVKDKLLRELRSAFPDVSQFPRYATLTDLPYLNNIWNEVLRLHAPLTVSLPRISPGKVIGGHYVPAGTKVGSLAYHTHRNPDVFPDPEKFYPERWDKATPEMKVMFRPFSLGPRNCIGMHIARQQVFLTVSRMYQRYDVTLDPTMTEKDMVEDDRGIFFPQAKTFRVSLKARQ
ncbi:Cytochrome P450-like protein 12 [Elsinoe fawcettii]|nr:Cytochrome P450-like protein 12 [Elsinoe fawcettii]